MDQEPDMIRQNIDQTRQSLSEKLESLECQVKGTVHEARSTVEETIQTVRSSIEETLDSLKRTVDIRYQTERHPWPMVGASTAVGFVVGALIGDRLLGTHTPSTGGGWRSETTPASFTSAGSTSSAPQPSDPGLLERLTSEFHDEIQQVKGMAITSVMAMVRDMAMQSIPPQFQAQAEQILNNLTAKLGGQPMAHAGNGAAGRQAGPASGRW